MDKLCRMVGTVFFSQIDCFVYNNSVGNVFTESHFTYSLTHYRQIYFRHSGSLPLGAVCVDFFIDIIKVFDDTVEQLDDDVDTTGTFDVVNGQIIFKFGIDFVCFDDDPTPTKFLITFNLTKVLTYAGCPFMGLLWDWLTGNLLPTAATVTAIPKDPPLPPVAGEAIQK